MVLFTPKDIKGVAYFLQHNRCAIALQFALDFTKCLHHLIKRRRQTPCVKSIFNPFETARITPEGEKGVYHKFLLALFAQLISIVLNEFALFPQLTFAFRSNSSYGFALLL